MKIGFWKITDTYGVFSNWYISEFIHEGHYFISSEQALMWHKAKLFGDTETMAKIMQTQRQNEIKALGREVKGYIEEQWAALRYKIMVDILKDKFIQNPSIASVLLSTGDAELYEASPYDRIWGIGSTDVNQVNGTNLLGKALMEVREYMRREA